MVKYAFYFAVIPSAINKEGAKSTALLKLSLQAVVRLSASWRSGPFNAITDAAPLIEMKLRSSRISQATGEAFSTPEVTNEIISVCKNEAPRERTSGEGNETKKRETKGGSAGTPQEYKCTGGSKQLVRNGGPEGVGWG